MQTFYFHLNHLKEFVVDSDGSELADLAAAAGEARQVIRKIAAECLKSRRQFTLLSVRISDEHDQLLYEVFVRKRWLRFLQPMF
jgi:hypothetical protein